jgi:hypothetical protein
LSANNFRKLIEHLIQENEKVLKSSAYQLPLHPKEEEKKRDSSPSSASIDQGASSSDQESQLFKSFDESRASPSQIEK